jgi:hypothetical protein
MPKNGANLFHGLFPTFPVFFFMILPPIAGDLL